MRALATEGSGLTALIQFAVPLCQKAEQRCPRKGPGRKPTIPDWVMAVLIVLAIAKQRKSKSSQYRFLNCRKLLLQAELGTSRFPARSTYFDRYRRAWRLLEVAIGVTGQLAIQKRLASPQCVAVDKSAVPARGPAWNKRQVARGRVPKGADLEATWTYSKHQGWVLGYSYEIVVTTEKTGTVWPLLASAGPASWQANRTFPEKIPKLPAATRYVLADCGYDSNALAELVESSAAGCQTGRRLLCPSQSRGNERRAARSQPDRGEKRRQRLRRAARQAFFRRPFAQRLFKRRATRIEPFNDWLKGRFDLHDHVWHRGLNNNRTQLLAAIFAYQLLLLLNHRHGNANGQIQWLLDQL